ncbi:hypothetical protein B932_2686 [Gluconobacter oxydans H24]|nr:hypothetical protein B932_2686 [Gluconobacter oxydans H24]
MEKRIQRGLAGVFRHRGPFSRVSSPRHYRRMRAAAKTIRVSNEDLS